MKKYHFTKAGVSAFLSDVIDDALNNGNYHDIVIVSGDRQIVIPMLPETWEELEIFIPAAEKLYREEYTEEE